MLRSVVGVGSHTVGIRAAGFVIAALSSSLLLTTAAQAGGSLKDEPVAAAEPTYVWDGLYVAAGIGVAKLGEGSFDAWKKIQKQKRYCKDQVPSIADEFVEASVVPTYCDNWSDWKDEGYPKTFPLAKGQFDDSWEGFGTLQIGYDRLLNDRILIGAFADIDFFPNADSDFHKNISYYDYNIGSVDSHFSLNHILNFGGRIGGLITPRILLYATGGYSRADIDGGVSVDLKYGPDLKLALPNHMDGYFIGGGGEVKIDRNVSLKFEYRFTDLGSLHADGSKVYDSQPWCSYGECTRTEKTTSARADFDEQIHSVRAALVIKLDDLHRTEEAAPLK